MFSKEVMHMAVDHGHIGSNPITRIGLRPIECLYGGNVLGMRLNSLSEYNEGINDVVV